MMHIYWMQFESSMKEYLANMKEKLIADFDGEASQMVAIFVFVAVPLLSLLQYLYAQYSSPSHVLSLFHRRRDNVDRSKKADEERERNGIQITCIVCLSQVIDGDEKPRFLPCNHGFHLNCINGWLKTHPTCPLCRYPVADFDHHRQHGRPNRFYHGWLSSFLLSLENFRQWLAYPLSPELMSSLFTCSGGFQ